MTNYTVDSLGGFWGPKVRELIYFCQMELGWSIELETLWDACEKLNELTGASCTLVMDPEQAAISWLNRLKYSKDRTKTDAEKKSIEDFKDTLYKGLVIPTHTETKEPMRITHRIRHEVVIAYRHYQIVKWRNNRSEHGMTVYKSDGETVICSFDGDTGLEEASNFAALLSMLDPNDSRELGDILKKAVDEPFVDVVATTVEDQFNGEPVIPQPQPVRRG